MKHESQEMIKQESKEPKYGSHYGKLFLLVLTIFTLLFGAFLIYANMEFCKSQENIKQSYAKHIQKADSLYWDMTTYNRECTSQIANANTIILADSLIRFTLGNKQRLSLEQYNRLHGLISIHFAEIEQLHEKYDNRIQRDSLLLITERQVLDGQVKAMLDLHLNKIEHEYSNITLWAAILTILFLVFSFYSIFKMDSLVHQGIEGVNEIKQLKRDGDLAIREIGETREKILKENDALMDKSKSELGSLINSQQRILTESISALKDNVNNGYNEALNSKLAELDSYLVEAKNMMSLLKNQTNEEIKDE
jgi:hypothetical protein